MDSGAVAVLIVVFGVLCIIVANFLVDRNWWKGLWEETHD